MHQLILSDSLKNKCRAGNVYRLTFRPALSNLVYGATSLSRTRKTCYICRLEFYLPTIRIMGLFPIFSPSCETRRRLPDGEVVGADLANKGRLVGALEDPREFGRGPLDGNVSPDFLIGGRLAILMGSRCDTNLEIVSIRQLLEVSLVWNSQVERVDDVCPAKGS